MSDIEPIQQIVEGAGALTVGILAIIAPASAAIAAMFVKPVSDIIEGIFGLKKKNKREP